MPRFRSIVSMLVLFLCVAPVLAQADDCPVLVDAALKSVGDVCAVTGLNQACYGNFSVKAEPQPGIDNMVFNSPGDVTRVANLSSLTIDPLDVAKKEWGVALMRLQANIPDTLPGQSVTFLMFGDVQLENKVDMTPSPRITLATDTILRGGPLDDSPIVGALTAGDGAFALSQSGDGQWVRVELDSGDARTGWIPASLLAEARELPVFDPEALAPMQAFSLRTGVSGVNCATAPEDGILVQSPGENIKIDLTVNDVHVELGSTALFRAQASNELTVSVLEGAGKVEALGQTIDVPAGTWVKIPMDENLEPTGVIAPATGYKSDTLANLPISLLERPITIAPAQDAVGQKLCVNNANGVWLRAQPDSANQTILETLTDGAAVTVTGAEVNDGQQDWLPVQVNVTYGSTGWVEATSLSECDTPVVVNCTPRSDWTITYAVQPGNTLAQIAQAAGISLNELAEANCIADVNRIISGQQLRVPRTVVLPTATPGASPTPAPSATATVDNGPKISTGTWTFVFTTQYVDCQTAAPPPAEVTRTDAYVDVSPDGQSLTWVVSSPGVQMQRTGTNTFYGTNPNIPGYTWTLTVTGTNQGNMYVTVPCDQYTSA